MRVSWKNSKRSWCNSVGTVGVYLFPMLDYNRLYFQKLHFESQSYKKRHFILLFHAHTYTWWLNNFAAGGIFFLRGSIKIAMNHPKAHCKTMTQQCGHSRLFISVTKKKLKSILRTTMENMHSLWCLFVIWVPM